jgi:hypothetical protein
VVVPRPVLAILPRLVLVSVEQEPERAELLC